MTKESPTSIDDLREIGLRERDALTVAATLPYLPDSNAFVWVDHDSNFWDNRRVEDFVDDVPTLGGTANVRRVSLVKDDPTPEGQARVMPTPHGSRTYTLSLGDVAILTKSDSYDWDTDQSLLSDWGVTNTVLYKHGNPFPDGYDFPRKPTLPAYTA